ncbi:MAG: Inorganic pyrophosphatase [Pseudomonadota bacterium]|nr:Inorganic pyrophosphatase [Pseudomonadota bacterium]
MSFMKVPSGRDVPHDINVIIEIPAYSDPVKYEVDKDTGALTVDRFMGTAMQYPTNYGYIPHSLSDDGDPVDVLVITPAPLLSGCVIRCRPIGVLKMVDEAGSDAKVLAVPVEKLTPCYKKVTTFEDISEDKLAKIAHFFQHYKDLEEGKWVQIEGWFGIEDAKREIVESISRYNAAEAKPEF